MQDDVWVLWVGDLKDGRRWPRRSRRRKRKRIEEAASINLSPFFTVFSACVAAATAATEELKGNCPSAMARRLKAEDRRLLLRLTPETPDL